MVFNVFNVLMFLKLPYSFQCNSMDHNSNNQGRIEHFRRVYSNEPSHYKHLARCFTIFYSLESKETYHWCPEVKMNGNYIKASLSVINSFPFKYTLPYCQ